MSTLYSDTLRKIPYPAQPLGGALHCELLEHTVLSRQMPSVSAVGGGRIRPATVCVYINIDGGTGRLEG